MVDGTGQTYNAGQTCSTSRSQCCGRSLVGALFGGLARITGFYRLVTRMMLVERKSRFGFDETVEALEAAIPANGWTVCEKLDMTERMAGYGHPIGARITLLQICQPEYAHEVLSERRDVSCLMPCTFSVWEADDGTVHVSKMNTGLMGKLFGGAVARVMGGRVGPDEGRILAAVADK